MPIATQVKMVLDGIMEPAHIAPYLTTDDDAPQGEGTRTWRACRPRRCSPGGRSSEHSISSATAGGILGAIDREKFNVIPVGITREGIFVLEQDDPARFVLDAQKLPEVVDNGTRVLWPLPGSGRELRALLEDGTVTSLGTVDVVLPILHGVHGEDGTIQGFFDTLEIPYAGGGVIDSAIAMDKDVTKVVLQAADIPVTPWLTVRRRRWEHSEATVRAEADALGYPLFVKLACAGLERRGLEGTRAG